MLKRLSLLFFALTLAISIPASAQWRSLGPYGGNARALAYDPSNPDHIILGSGAGALFESIDGGRHWRHFAHLGAGQDLMLEDVVFDPSHPATMYVAAWSVMGSGGGFFITRDGGRNWSEPADLRGKSVQALAMAASDPRILVAGSLDGLYRSTDKGETWTRISPVGHPDLKNFESVAIDPRNPQIIYAGTWHLPWKTTDGGVTWKNIKQGMIDDSDVFSIIIDHTNPQIVFASACSGIYKSENGGELFHKIQGIPSTARRTRVLQQDPVDARVVYAGTTEGLWKTVDGGKVFKLTSPPNFILNDVMVDPRNSKRVLIATDRAGIFASDDAGLTFHASNDGFSQRQITSLVVGTQNPSDIYAGIVNDKEFGGVFRIRNGAWHQLSDGLGGSDVFDLRESSKGQLVAGTNRGIYLLEPKTQRWVPSKDVVSQRPAPSRRTVRGKNGKVITAKTLPATLSRSVFQGRVTAVALNPRRWYAATDAGVLTSANEGKSWSGGPVEGEKAFLSVSANDKIAVATTLRKVWFTSDEGEHWSRAAVPEWVSRIYSATVASDGVVWLATREGALRWKPESQVWEHVLNGLPTHFVRSIRDEGGLLLATAEGSSTVYLSRDHGQSWQTGPGASFEITGAAVQGDRLFVTTWHNGLLMQEPQVVAAAGQQ